MPLLEREVRQLIDANEEKLRALILIDIAFVAAVAEARGGTVAPGHQMFCFVVALVCDARNVAPEMRQ